MDLVNEQGNLLGQDYNNEELKQMLKNCGKFRKCCVSESAGRLSGVICLNGLINVDLLTEHFELEPYNGLCKVDNAQRDRGDRESDPRLSSRYARFVNSMRK